MKLKFNYCILFCCSLILLNAKAQTPTFDCYITNDTFISPTVYQFDLYLLRTGTVAFEYAMGQFAIAIDTACVKGGTLTASIVSGSCQLTVNQCPTTVQSPLLL